MGFIFYFLGILAFSCKSVPDPAENLVLVDEYDINIKTEYVRLDQLNNLVVVDDNNFIHRFTDQTFRKFTYNDNTLGKITHIDATDPLKITIYKKDYGVAIFLDNTLSEIDRINLYEKGFTEIPCLASSNDGNLWIYDLTDYRLKKVNNSGTVILESMSMIDFGHQDITPFYIQERNGKVVLQDANKGVFLFDNLGQYIQQFPFKIGQEIQFDGKNICYLEGGEFVCYHVELYSEKSIPLDSNKKAGLLNVKAGDNNLYLIYKEGIDIVPIRS